MARYGNNDKNGLRYEKNTGGIAYIYGCWGLIYSCVWTARENRNSPS